MVSSRPQMGQHLESDMNHLQMNNAEKQLLAEKLQFAEQDLDQLTIELESLRRENNFLSKLNKQVTHHAFKHETKKLDLRRQNAFGDA